MLLNMDQKSFDNTMAKPHILPLYSEWGKRV